MLRLSRLPCGKPLSLGQNSKRLRSAAFRAESLGFPGSPTLFQREASPRSYRIEASLFFAPENLI